MVVFKYKDSEWTITPALGRHELARPTFYATLWETYEKVTDSPVVWAYVMMFASLILQAKASPAPAWLIAQESSGADMKRAYGQFLEWIDENKEFVALAQNALRSVEGGEPPNA